MCKLMLKHSRAGNIRATGLLRKHVPNTESGHFSPVLVFFFFFFYCVQLQPYDGSNTKFRAMLGYFGVSIIHRTLTWPAGSLTYVGNLFACVYDTRGTSGNRFHDSLIRRTLAAVVESALTEFQ